MQTTRKRKPPKSRTKDIHIQDDNDLKKPSYEILQQLSRHLNPYKLLQTYPYKLLFLFILLLLLYITWPGPKLSKHAQHWHDSGYMFNYRGRNVFFQDIICMKKPVRLQPVLLILHGFPTSSYDWKNLIPEIHSRFGRVVIPDMLGSGFSDKPIGHDYSIKEQATIVDELLTSLNILDVHVLAHDYGDTVAQELLARDSEAQEIKIRIRSVCLTNGGILPDNHQPLLIQKLLLIPVFNTILSRLSNSYIFMSRLSSVFGPDTQPTYDNLIDFWSIVRHKEGNLAMPAILKYMPERQANKERWVIALQRTRVPLHLIYGPLDPINTPQSFLTSYQQLIVNSTVNILDNTGHYPHLEDEVGFMKSYHTFLDRVEKEFHKL